MDYVTVAEARDLPGLRLVLSAHVPGPWGEAAKAVLKVRNVPYVPVEQVPLGANDELFAWTGLRNAPTAMYEDEPPQATWIEILLLAERLGSGPSLIPTDPIERALCFGFATEICGPDGFGWSRRLQLYATSTTKRPKRMDDDYGGRADAIARAPIRMASIMRGLAAQLHRQRSAGSSYLVGERLSACDLHWACFAGHIAPLPHEACPMDATIRGRYSSSSPEIVAALDPILLEHRDLMFARHIGLPMDF